MAERKFLSSVEALGLQESPRSQAAPPAPAPAPTDDTLLLVRYGQPILRSLQDAGGEQPMTALLAAVEGRTGRAFRIEDALAAARALERHAAVRNEGSVCVLTQTGRIMLGDPA
jgi:hypothetical protein